MEESALAEALGAIAAAHPEVEIGSYPRWIPGEGGRLRSITRVTFEAPPARYDRVQAAAAAFAAFLGSRVYVDPAPRPGP